MDLDRLSFQAGAIFSAALAAAFPWFRKFLVSLVIFAATTAGKELVRQYVEHHFKKKKS